MERSATATWWIPMPVILGVWRHVYRRFPLKYSPMYWGARIIHQPIDVWHKFHLEKGLRLFPPKRRASKPDAQAKGVPGSSFACASGLNNPG
jgi:hypothetical protein